MRNSCVSRPANRRKIIINEADLEFTGGNVCAAALISYFEYWHNIRLNQRQKAIEENDIRQAHGDTRTQNESQVQFHTLEQLEAGLCGMYRRDSIRLGLSILIEKKVVDQFKNPNPRYSFDKTSHFLFHPEILNDWFSDPDRKKSTLDERISDYRGTENQPPSSENRTAIHNITQDTTSEKKDIYIHRSAVAQKTPVHRIDKPSKEQQGIWFQEWWGEYWRKESRIPAWKAFQKHIVSEKRFQELMAITRTLQPEMLQREPQFRKTAAAWLNTEPWNDAGEVSPPQASKRALLARERDTERLNANAHGFNQSAEPFDEAEFRKQLKANIG